jgi:general secretion pathway protein K
VSTHARQRGVALLVALLVVALATILVAALLDRGELGAARTRNLLRGEQAEAYAQGLELYAEQVLLLADQQGGPDTNASPWALPLPPQPVPGGVIGATMRDRNGCFNLNNLLPADEGGNPAVWQPVFEHLLDALGVDSALAPDVVAWLDPAPAAIDNSYLAQAVPYRPAHRAFAHVSELRLVRGVGGEVYARLAPHVCALPPGTRINVNTASVPVLQALLGPGTSAAVAQNLWQNGAAHWQGIGQGDDFPNALARLQVPVPAGLTALANVKSGWFLARGDIVLDGVPFTFFSLIDRDTLSVVERSRGADDVLAGPALPASGANGSVP